MTHNYHTISNVFAYLCVACFISAVLSCIAVVVKSVFGLPYSQSGPIAIFLSSSAVSIASLIGAVHFERKHLDREEESNANQAQS